MKLAFAPFIYYMALSSNPQETATSTSTTTKMSATSTTSASVPGVTTGRLPSLRSFTLPTTTTARTQSLDGRTNEMNSLFKEGSPLSPEEIDDIIHSVQNVYPSSSTTTTTKDEEVAASSSIDLDKLKDTLKEIAHISHKDWSVTEANSITLGDILLKDGMTASSSRQLLERILQEGNWDGAAKHAAAQAEDKSSTDGGAVVLPWAVLVTGVNGIRKTTSIYQPWWPDLLQEALISPPTTTANDSSDSKKRKAPPGDDHSFTKGQLPTGSNSFFRQLDHMIATLCNEDFKILYYLTQQELEKETDSANDKDDNKTTPSSALVKKYSDLKAAIFSRYRTLSELLGAHLLKEAQKLQSNCMMETSGRDVAMFYYVDHFFPKDSYNKLALHFTINDLSQAQESVDKRMVQEINNGIEAVNAKDDFKVIYANAGGPYGSEVLPGVQEASDSVWNDVVLKGQEVGQDWYKATIAINAHPTKPWTAQAVRPDGSLGTVFTFSNKR